MLGSERERNDLPIVSKRFKAIATLAIRRMEDGQKAKQGKATYKTYTQAINRYLIPFLGNHNIDKITSALMHEFAKWRIVEMGKVPSASVLNNHSSALN